MATRNSYLEQASDYSRRALEKGKQYVSGHRDDARRGPSKSTLAWVAAGALLVYAGVHFGSDLVRYFHMRRM